MKIRYLFFAGLFYCCVNIVACKLDPPILPGDKGYVATSENTVPGTKGNTGSTGATGTTGATGKTDTTKTPPPYFTGFWFCKSNFTEVYNNAGVLQSSTPSDSFYYSITFDSLKAIGAFKLSGSAPRDPQSFPYEIIKDDAGNNYVLFEPDPFFRSSNTKIQVLDKTVNTMTWLIFGPRPQNSDGVQFYTATRLNLVKISK